MPLLQDISGIGSVRLESDFSGRSRLSFALQPSRLPAENDLLFASLAELPTELQFLLSCGFFPDVVLARQALACLPKHCDPLSLLVPGLGVTALEWATLRGNAQIVEWLCEDPRTRGLVQVGALVGWACHANRIKIARTLVQFGATSIATNDAFWGFSPPLMVAAERGHLQAMKWLIEEERHDITMQSGRYEGVLDAIVGNMKGRTHLSAG
eukprot:CAMPEP_0204178426 /NCGR_PEP_ID=MMETSP0361-20130328/49315_1 /ASSEMBLY_ACC=CAM_ASM_000343 /TAXON_ID=268821 /ORGANISM="Scrippsiella Hangoei, Strain SHTV-5" /LENGTH=210 /DNA_ID=CAMNT_0051137541 /DNA_START=6 /DNA_END=634 /DNA_ORIENTATION=+